MRVKSLFSASFKFKFFQMNMLYGILYADIIPFLGKFSQFFSYNLHLFGSLNVTFEQGLYLLKDCNTFFKRVQRILGEGTFSENLELSLEKNNFQTSHSPRAAAFQLLKQG